MPTSRLKALIVVVTVVTGTLVAHTWTAGASAPLVSVAAESTTSTTSLFPFLPVTPERDGSVITPSGPAEAEPAPEPTVTSPSPDLRAPITTSGSPPTTAPPTTAPSTTAPPSTTTTIPEADREDASDSPSLRPIPPPDPPGTGEVAPSPPSENTQDGGDSTASPAYGTGGFPASLRALMDSVQRSGSSSSASLVEALASLGQVGMDPTEAAVAGFGRFPVAGRATYSHDWWFPRFGPGWRLHQGTDVFAAMGTPVRSPSAGVVRISQGGLGGLSVKVVEPDATYWYLAHLAGLAPGLVDGAEVEVGQVLAYTGNSGNAAGGPPHVHVELHPKGGGPVDPKADLDGFLAEALAEAPALVTQLTTTEPTVVSTPTKVPTTMPTAIERPTASSTVPMTLPDAPEELLSTPTAATRSPLLAKPGLDLLVVAGVALVLLPVGPSLATRHYSRTRRDQAERCRRRSGRPVSS